MPPITTRSRNTAVILHIYDLSPANDYLYPLGLSIHHSGVEVLGIEYSFASGAGIFESCTPKDAPGAKYRESIPLGSFVGGSQEVRNAVGDLTRDFSPDAYHLIHKNCNHFANAFVYRLLRKEIPPFVNRLANIGRYMSCLLPKKMLEIAPVGGTTAGGDGNDASHGSFGGSSGALFRAYPPVGSTSTVRWNKSSTSRGASFRRKEEQHALSRVEEDETDLREKVRLAAIKRWENQKK